MSSKSLSMKVDVDASVSSRRHDSSAFALGHNPVQDLTPVRGATFRNQLSELAQSKRQAVLLSAPFPVAYSSSRVSQNLNKRMDASISHAYSLKSHPSTVSSTSWTQGLMEPMVGTEWSAMLPQKLSIEHATNTLRAVKSIMGHDVKPMALPDITTKPGANLMAKSATRPAASSFVEDVTGELATSTRHTGSAVRAMLLRAKLMMKEKGSSKIGGFWDYARGVLPQLESGGAASHAQTIHEELRSSSTSKTATEYAGRVKAEHDLLHDQIGKRFESKHAEFEKMKSASKSTEEIRQHLGDYWGAHHQAGTTPTAESYVARKYTKHGIGDV